jgi:hypothetical protein
MIMLKRISLVVAGVAFLCAASHAQSNINWYGFSKNFITTNYPQDSAFGSIAARKWQAAASVHSVSCGGNDGELHIGIFLADVDLPADQTPATAPVDDSDQGWGLVAELPNAADGDGPGLLRQALGQPATFTGFFRVWDEGHSKGSVAGSNPHHVFEVHSAWAFQAGGSNFEDKELVDSISGYSGYGASKFQPLLRGLDGGDWPMAYQDDSMLHVGLVRADNFYQLPIIVRQIDAINGGHAITVDVFSSATFSNLVYQGLRCITVSGSPTDDQAAVDQKAFWLGFFSVNLRKALDGSQSANSEDNAVAIKDAVEFFVFGPAKKRAVASCSRK